MPDPETHEPARGSWPLWAAAVTLLVGGPTLAGFAQLRMPSAEEQAIESVETAKRQLQAEGEKLRATVSRIRDDGSLAPAPPTGAPAADPGPRELQHSERLRTVGTSAGVLGLGLLVVALVRWRSDRPRPKRERRTGRAAPVESTEHDSAQG